ncbi:hypothetical protein PUNSTDRAFT_24244, partial [Punctularia strigosozonata HHB-11173 SS5]|uniref:uncharacterized protein n=1 Tax=Punctularia strigosozonata (strain HHB-11173) TaxID=741275 RepID=UPI0004418085
LPASTLAVPSDAAAKHHDPCAAIAGKEFLIPSQALACHKSFAFNETLRKNVMDNVARVFDFFTFEDYYYESPAPFQQSTVDIRGEVDRISKAKYETDYDFNRDLYNFTTSLNDGHTGWFPSCYLTIQSILPAPLVSLEENGEQDVYVAPDSVEFISQLGSGYTDVLDELKFDWKRIAGAKVLEIEGKSAYDYVDEIANKVSGNYLDHGIRVNSVFSSYRIQSNAFSQRLGDGAGPSFADRDGIKMKLIPANSTKSETVWVPFVADYLGANFTDKASYWENNCVATNTTNGQNYATEGDGERQSTVSRPRAKANVIDKHPSNGLALPPQYQPNISSTAGSEGVIKSYVLPGNKTGVMFVGSFEPDDYVGFQSDVVNAIKGIKKAGAKNLIIDLTNNGGGYVCLGVFLHQYLAGSKFGYGGFQSTARASKLAQKIVANNIKLNLTGITNYSPVDWAFLNGTAQPEDYNYIKPSVKVTINGRSDATSQRFEDVCEPYDVDLPEDPPFALENVKIVGNGNCASTCAMFSTLMYERHNTSVAIFGGKPGRKMQFKGMAGNQVLDWPDLDSEIITANLQDDPLAPPPILVNGNMRVNWRTAWSWLDEKTPIAYMNEHAQLRFAYTKDTYNNPLNLWKFAEQKLY